MFFKIPPVIFFIYWEQLVDEIIEDDTGNIEEGNSGEDEDNEDGKEVRADVQVSESENDNASD